MVKSAGSKEAQNIYLVLSEKEERFITFKPTKTCFVSR